MKDTTLLGMLGITAIAGAVAYFSVKDYLTTTEQNTLTAAEGKVAAAAATLPAVSNTYIAPPSAVSNVTAPSTSTSTTASTSGQYSGSSAPNSSSTPAASNNTNTSASLFNQLLQNNAGSPLSPMAAALLNQNNPNGANAVKYFAGEVE
jgi:uncharacterized membrane protein